MSRKNSALCWYSALSGANLANDGRVFANLITKLLIHADDHRVSRFDVGESGLELKDGVVAIGQAGDGFGGRRAGQCAG